MNYTAANRDEDMFAEPHTFDVTRSPNPHIAFGWGPHLCLGASLARLELRSIYTELFKRTKTIEFADPNYQPVYSHASFVRGIQSLPVKFSCSTTSVRRVKQNAVLCRHRREPHHS